MWFMFGFVTLISFSIYCGYKRMNADWGGTLGNSGGVRFRYRVLKGKYKTNGLLVGVNGPAGYDYSLKKETSFDRFFKFVGLSSEHQTGNEEFDELVYVVSDNRNLHRQISSNARLSEAVLEVFKSSDKYNCKVKEIRNCSGKLWVRYRANRGFDKDKVLAQAAEVAIILEVIAKEIESMPRLPCSRWKDPFVLKAAVILGISTGFALNGLFHVLRLTITKVPFTIDSEQLLVDSIFWGVGLVILFIVVSIIILGRSARAHLVIVELLLIGTFGFVSTSFSELRDINIEFDRSFSTIYEVETIDKSISRSRRSTSYFLYLSDWNKEEESKKIKVSSDFYNSVAIGDKIEIDQRDGYLNYRWVASIRKNYIEELIGHAQ